MKYTEAPWKATKIIKYGFVQYQFRLDEENPDSTFIKLCNWAVDSEELEGNKNLIESIPNLFETNKKLLEQIINYEEISDTIEELRRIVDKIEGDNS